MNKWFVGLTDEQRAAAESMLTVATAVPSAPGAGKTHLALATASAIADDGDTVAALTFGKQAATELSNALANVRGATGSTLHSVAYQTLPNTLKFRARNSKGINAMFIAKTFGFGGPKDSIDLPGDNSISAIGMGKLLRGAYDRFCASTDTVAKRWIMGDPFEDESANEMVWTNYIRPTVERWWADNNDATFSRSFLPMTHGAYFKRYVLSQLRRPEPVASVILLDEAQDSDRLTVELMRAWSSAGSRINVIGDPRQQIYEWRGAVDAMDALSDLTERTCHIRTSFRFGQDIADLANLILANAKERHNVDYGPTLIGNPDRTSTVNHEGIEANAFLARTNASILGAAVTETRPFCIVGLDAIRAEIESIEPLAARDQKCTHDELKYFNSWDSAVSDVRSGDSTLSPEAARLVRLIDQTGIAEIMGVCDRSEKRISDAEIVMSTCHKAKGATYKNVIVADDFPSLKASKDDDAKPKDCASVETFRLAFVAVTRATGNVAHSLTL